MTETRPVIRVVDDDDAFRNSLTRLLRLSGYETESYDSGSALLAHFDNKIPGCVVLDLDMPQNNGLQIQTQMSNLGAALPIIFLSGRGDIPASVKAIKAGAEDFLCKPARKQQLIEAIERAIARSQEELLDRAQLDELRSRLAKLTPRERQVYDLVVAGKLNKQIAYTLNTTERTIKAHRHKVMWKLQARSVVELVSIADRFASLSHHGQPASE